MFGHFSYAKSIRDMTKRANEIYTAILSQLINEFILGR